MAQRLALDTVGLRVQQFSDGKAPPVTWRQVVDLLDRAEMFWLSTVRTDGRPHVVPLPAVWHDGTLHFCTGVHEQKARNIAHDTRCALTTGTNEYRAGMDVVVEGRAFPIEDRPRLESLAALWLAQYDWPFTATDEGFVDRDATDSPIPVYELRPCKVLVFTKAPYSQTRFTFAGE